MKPLRTFTKVIVVLFFFEPVSKVVANESVLLPGDFYNKTVQVTSWKALRDEKIVKQKLDYSCGAASLATLLSGFYNHSITEEELLILMLKEDIKASFSDMANALEKIGFEGIGYATSYEQLTKIKIPVIVYLQHRKNSHFSVLRGVNETTVWLADPSLGNVTLNKYQFLKMWQTREDNFLKGKILAVLPADREISDPKDYFTNTPQRQSSHAVDVQALRIFQELH